MSWYYAQGKERLGPVEDGEFQRLLEQGVITDETLIWRDGLPGWQPRKVVAIPGIVTCTACRRSVAEADSFLLQEKPYCGTCKPQILQRIQEGKPLPVSNAEETRRKYLSHEASVKSVGLLYYLGGTALFIMGVLILVGFTSRTFRASEGGVSVGLAAFYLILSVVQIFTATGLRKLSGWARIPAGILSGLGLLAFPIGTIINGYVLYLLFSEKGSMVFSAEYQEIVAATPHIKYKTSIVVWVLIGLVVLVLGIIAFAAIFGH